jgi:hypothetical protein
MELPYQIGDFLSSSSPFKQHPGDTLLLIIIKHTKRDLQAFYIPRNRKQNKKEYERYKQIYKTPIKNFLQKKFLQKNSYKKIRSRGPGPGSRVPGSDIGSRVLSIPSCTAVNGRRNDDEACRSSMKIEVLSGPLLVSV